MLKQNIVDSDYYNKTCLQLNNWSEVIDEIYDNVFDVEPWLGGNARGPSTAFCLLHRLATLKPTIQDVRNTITHKDSPYIRAVRRVAWSLASKCLLLTFTGAGGPIGVCSWLAC